MKLAVVLFNLGGPDTPEAVGPFLKNLFSDPAIISLPGVVRKPLAAFIARGRTPIAQEIYAKIGGRSPIVEETERQARALEVALSVDGAEVKAFIAMRYWKPFSDETARAVKAWSPDKIVLLPLYPQFSTTTTQSSLDDWKQAAQRAGLSAPTRRVCCYPWDVGFVNASVALIRETMAKRRDGVSYRLLLSAHGLPERTIAKGDPYRWQVEKTAEAIVAALGISGLDWNVCYQSRVGRLKWIGPATDTEIRRAGADGKGVIVVPVAFVSEHSETLVELDIEYGHLAKASGVVDYLRTPTVGHHAAFIAGLARLVSTAALGQTPVTCGDGRICPREFARCGF
ncbi:MAG: ferrochelatase [Acidobacteriaceae bacterium]|nr:ferrochelatase [Acidobacteriaceae bacterium]